MSEKQNDVKHSPTPWRAVDNGEGHKTIIHDARGVSVSSAWVVDAPGRKSNYAEIDANAAIIVEAVNAHERLVAENARLRDALSALVEYWNWGGFDAMRESRLKDEARAAIGEEAAND